MKRLLTVLLAGISAGFASCGDDGAEKGDTWFLKPEAVVSGTTAEISCRTKFADGVLTESGAGFVYTRIGAADGYFDAEPVEVSGNALSCRLSDLEPETDYLVYAYLELGGAGRMQSESVSFRTGKGSDPGNAPAFGQPAYSEVTRIPNSSSAVVKINEAVISNIAQQQRLMSRTIWLAGIFLIVLIAILWFVLWQHRRLQGSHEQLIRMSDLLREKHDELLKKNDHIRDINNALVDSNRIKDRYVCHYIDLSVHYIKQIDAFRREVCRIAKTKGADEVVRRLNSSQVIDGEYQKFYQSFDSSFLDIFPNFIGQVNELLQPEFRFTPRSDSSLTTERRILAAIRLGITDSGHIASLLNCASATVYTYRTKLRNAALDRDNFEEQVPKTGL